MAASTLRSPGTEARGGSSAVRATSAAALGGLAGGITLGAAYRAWMRLASTNPEFTWSGTMFIVGLVTVATVMACVAHVARLRWRRRWARRSMRALAGAAVLLTGVGPGMITVPTWVLGGLAIGRRGWPARVRVLLALLAVAGVIPLVLVTGAAELQRLGALRSGAALLGYLGLMAVFARMFAVFCGDQVLYPAPREGGTPAIAEPPAAPPAAAPLTPA